MGPIDVYLVRYAFILSLQMHGQMTMPYEAMMFDNCKRIKIDIPDLPFSLCHSSQFEEKFEEINGVDVAPKFQSNPEFNNQQSAVVSEERGKDIEVHEQDGHGPSSDFTTSQDFVSGIMKIVPSDVDVSITRV